MKHDYQSYKRAASVSLLGLGLQLAMGLTLLIYSFVAKPQGDLLCRAGGVFVLLGCMVWLVLAIVFDQHRRERIEQMELEAIGASGVRDSSAFSEGSDAMCDGSPGPPNEPATTMGAHGPSSRARARYRATWALPPRG